MTYEETWAIARSRIEEFFRSQADIVPLDDGGFRCGSAVARLQGLPNRKLGSMEMFQTIITIDGDPEDAQRLYRRFFMRFISAGG